MKKNGGDKILTELKINEHYFIFSQGHEPLIALCFNDSWIHATVCVFLIIACGYNLAKEVFQIFDEVRCKHDMLSQSAVALSGKCLVQFVLQFCGDIMKEEIEEALSEVEPCPTFCTRLSMSLAVAGYPFVTRQLVLCNIFRRVARQVARNIFPFQCLRCKITFEAKFKPGFT